MFGIGFGEMLVIGVLILIAVGPDKLPTMVRTLARTYRQFRRMATEIRASTGIDDLLRDEELRELAELRKQKLALLAEKPGTIAKPLGDGPLPAKKPGAAPAQPDRPRLSDVQRAMESPSEGVDIAEATHLADQSKSKHPAEAQAATPAHGPGAPAPEPGEAEAPANGVPAVSS